MKNTFNKGTQDSDNEIPVESKTNACRTNWSQALESGYIPLTGFQDC